ncbi:adenylyltransferase/cytidyltransferase family protein [Arthrobacter sp. zg-Y769]|uniref:adenylyltransferase/cytidyltransferase family protein n=1 Tax=Arthrobacter sp. zg-Y769 TaxID=2894191 RepID=UPI001E448733|nr:adenylyltransferase/cytidyltransferase family protein [Arthrobacter sp. zg-Y769]MCC9205415.1 adenylyltransferase/cytidyltransferase family protein [Arthrobacter sp. zg-Y769]
MATRIGYAAGAFDLFHVGHLNILRQARLHCDVLVAGAVSDELCLASKGRLPVVPLHERMEILRHIDLVDRVVSETSADRLQVWQEVGFNVFFKGDDWKGTAKGRAIERSFAAVGVEVVYFPYTVHTSSTVLRRALEVMASGQRGSAQTLT